MLEQKDLNKIKEITKEFFDKMTISVSSIDASLSNTEKDLKDGQPQSQEDKKVVDLNIKLEEPQILIGQGGQTLFEIQRLLRTIFNKKFQDIFYLNLDINDYKNKKLEYLKSLARDLADEVALTKKERTLAPMSSYERRIIHAELSNRADVITESQGDGIDRHIIIKIK